MGILRFSHSSVLPWLAGPGKFMAELFNLPRCTAVGVGVVVCNRPLKKQLELPFDCNMPSEVKQMTSKGSVSRDLKVIRTIDLGVSPGCAGRMVISGRMADVCAELERMARRDNTMH